MVSRDVTDFETWREAARELIGREVRPEDVQWIDRTGEQGELPLFGFEASPPHVVLRSAAVFHVPKAFVAVARQVACHRAVMRWSLLYRVLWRILHGERELLDVEVDEDVHALHLIEQAVKRDIHKMHAFVRFEKQVVDGGEEFLAYYRPDHRIVRLAVPFFVERFESLRWTIMGPDETVRWNGDRLEYLPGTTGEPAGSGDDLVGLWRSYYSATFNPARLNTKMMRREMPERFWSLLPETQNMEELVATAPARTADLVAKGGVRGETPLSAKPFLPAERDLATLAEAARCCQGCPLYAKATQTVFGEGPANARVVFVGEQPGDQEDLEGKPFVGPAGQVFDELLLQAGIVRTQVYVTNTVKHFKWEPRGKRRIHSKPDSREIFACRSWLEAELEAIRPDCLVLLGATAAQAIFGPQFRITRERGQPRKTEWAAWTVATYHPSAVLRAGDAAHALQIRNAMAADLGLVAEQLRQKH